MRNLIKYCLVLIVFCLVSSCNSFLDVKKEAPEVNEIPANTKFRIIIPENHTHGYVWQLTQDYDRNVIHQINEVWHGNEKGIYFNLNSLASGQTTLTFVSRKYQDTADIKHFIVKIGGN